MSAIGKFSYFIAFVDQLEKALTEDHGIDRVTDAVESLGSLLDVLVSDSSESAGGDDGGIPEGIDDLDAPGDDTPLGAALARIAELEQREALHVDKPRRRLGGSATTGEGPQLGVSRKRPDAPILKKGARRGTKSKTK